MTLSAVRAEGPALVRHERNAEATKGRLLAAAEVEFAAKGFDGARLGNIARAAGVQQALVHHYFSDKEGLYREVLARGFAAITRESWGILGRLEDATKEKRRSGEPGSELTELTEAFVDVLVRFYASHGALLAILRHETNAGGGGRAGETIAHEIEKDARPVFDAVVRRIERLKAKGEVRRDVNARQLCVSTMAMACFPFQEERLLHAMWPVDWRDPDFIQERKREIVETVLSRARPRSSLAYRESDH
jgi:TetR/AcrR family transcriptional regulator